MKKRARLYLAPDILEVLFIEDEVKKTYSLNAIMPQLISGNQIVTRRLLCIP